MKDNPQEFESLRRVLALKRHEVPPPGYFESFSSKVIHQIEAEEARQARGFFAQVADLFRARPAISWSFCVASVLVLFASGTLFEQPPAPATVPSLTGGSLASKPAPAQTTPLSSSASLVFSTNFQATEMTGLAGSSTNGSRDSLFDTPFYQQVEPVSFSR